MGNARSELWRWLAFLVLLAVVAAGAYALLGRPAPSSGAVLLQGGAVEPSAGVLKVYVSGEVLRPGVYDLQPGQRVEDALALAGGPTAKADLRDLNLAAKVKDEQHVRVPAGRSAPDPAPTTAAASTPPAGRVNVNTATPAQLEALPGIGPVYAQRIIERRPYRATSELEAVLGKSLAERIKPLVSVE